METLIALLVFVVIAVVLLWLVDQLGLPNGKIVKVIVVAILLVVFLVRFAAPYLRLK